LSQNQEKKRLGLSEFFSELGGLLESFAKVLESRKPEARREGEIKDFGGIKGVSVAYNFSLKTLVNDEPTVRGFRNTHGHSGKSPGEMEPLIDIFDEGNHLTVVAELPGAKENDIKLSLEGNLLKISADTSAGEYRKEVLLPNPVKTDLIEAAYKNNVLEIKLEKALFDN